MYGFFGNRIGRTNGGETQWSAYDGFGKITTETKRGRYGCLIRELRLPTFDAGPRPIELDEEEHE